ncbi:MAG: hypothetical protein PGN13_11345 [Patulibacter minatonensis]
MLPAPVRAGIAGIAHGALEWLPVSSSGHTALLIDAAGWPEADPARARQLRTLEVALHTGSLLPLGLRVLAHLRTSDAPGRLVAGGVASTAITSVVGAAAGPLIEERFAGPRAVAAGLVCGSVALLAAERVPARRGIAGLTATDVVAVGLAQGAAIWPGTSRRAATLAAARARGLHSEAADALSWAAGLPTLLGATTWQGYRDRSALGAAAGTVVAGAATSAATGLLTRALPDRTRRWPAAAWAAWRLTLAAATLQRARRR